MFIIFIYWSLLLRMGFPDSYVQEAMGGITKKKNNNGKPSGGTGTSSSGTTVGGTGTGGSGAVSSGGATVGAKDENQKWVDSLPPDEAITSPCAESAAVREKECEVVRRRTELQLEKVGCPSYVSPKYNLSGQENPNPNLVSSGGCGSCGQTQTSGCPQQQAVSNNNYGSCGTGTCNRT